jgi:hypothetical protein
MNEAIIMYRRKSGFRKRLELMAKRQVLIDLIETGILSLGE